MQKKKVSPKRKARSKPKAGEWISVKTSLPKKAGMYQTLVRPYLEKESFVKKQRYEPISNPMISGWQWAITTHWRSFRWNHGTPCCGPTETT
jgi:hypothetical protein